MIEVEKKGIPTVAWCDDGFIEDAKMSARVSGATGFGIAVLPGPSAQLPAAENYEQVAGSINSVIEYLTKPVPPFESDGEASADKVLNIKGSDLLDATEKFNRYCLEKGISDGFPLVPPTPQAVEKMLAGTRLPKEQVIGILEPGRGIATVEKIAINAVMAGCRPEHMPVLITVIKCVSDPVMTLRRNIASTGANAPFMLINGPIAKRLNINSKCSALDPGSPSYANIVIGRALSLMLLNIAQGYPGIGSMSTIGSSLNYSSCVAENEDASPWVPYQVEKGFGKDVSTLTLMFVRGGTTYGDLTSNTAESMARGASWIASRAMNTDALWLVSHGEEKLAVIQGTRNLFLICPAHAKVLAKEGWDKKALRQYLYDHARLPFDVLMFGKEPALVQKEHPQFYAALKDYPSVPLPIVSTPNNFEIAVVGGVGPCSSYYEGHGAVITMPIEE